MTNRRPLKMTNNNVKGAGMLAFLCGTGLMGVLLGAMSFTMGNTALENIPGKAGLELRLGGDPGAVLWGSVLGSSMFLLLVFVTGLCPLGQAGAAAALIFRGLGVGAELAGAYVQKGTDKLPFVMLLFVPGLSISMIALILGVREAFSMSGVYLRFTLSERQVDGAMSRLRLYTTRFLVLEAGMAAAACTDCIMSIIVSGYL